LDRLAEASSSPLLDENNALLFDAARIQVAGRTRL
jgi:hypothetical protein